MTTETPFWSLVAWPLSFTAPGPSLPGCVLHQPSGFPGKGRRHPESGPKQQCRTLSTCLINMALNICEHLWNNPIKIPDVKNYGWHWYVETSPLAKKQIGHQNPIDVPIAEVWAAFWRDLKRCWCFGTEATSRAPAKEQFVQQEETIEQWNCIFFTRDM